jgi:hypothetical protein
MEVSRRRWRSVLAAVSVCSGSPSGSAYGNWFLKKMKGSAMRPPDRRSRRLVALGALLRFARLCDRVPDLLAT